MSIYGHFINGIVSDSHFERYARMFRSISSCFRDFKKQQQLQQLDKSLTSVAVSPRHCSANIGSSGQ
jgi:hypothetical protein